MFSIIIPVYNVAPYLRECLDSVLAQTFPDWEAVCVDDGSADGSGAILDEYRARDARFKVLHQRNAGVSAARNAALRVADGEYVTFLDGDDVYDRGWLAEAHRVIAETGADFLRMRLTYFSDRLPAGTLSQAYSLYDGNAAVREWGYRTFAESGYACVVFLKRECMARKGWHDFPVDMKFMEDGIFNLRNIALFCKAADSEFAGYYYRTRPGAVTCSLLKIDLFERLFREYRDLVDGLGREIVAKANKMLQCALLSWVEHGDRSSGGGDERMSIMVRQLVEDGYLDLRLVPMRWRLGYMAVVRFRSFAVMDVLFILMGAWRRIRMAAQVLSVSNSKSQLKQLQQKP